MSRRNPSASVRTLQGRYRRLVQALERRQRRAKTTAAYQRLDPLYTAINRTGAELARRYKATRSNPGGWSQVTSAVYRNKTDAQRIAARERKWAPVGTRFRVRKINRPAYTATDRGGLEFFPHFYIVERER